MRLILKLLLVAVLLAPAAGYWLTRPDRVDPEAFAGLTPDVARGETLYYAGGCASCHAAPEAEGEAKLVLAGGHRLESDFGTFVAPNISPDPEHGIGAWSALDLANAMLRGVSPEGRHYYPSFPYTSYIHMSAQDIVDLKAFLDTLPASDTPNAAHDLAFPFTLRRGIGLWKALYLEDDYVLANAATDTVVRGRYLVEGPGHCAECHTPRDAFGGLDRSAWMTGAPNPSGRGSIPAIDPANLSWSESEIAYYLETGFTPDFDSAGGHMARVVENTSQLPEEDRQAIAAYLKALP